jgi:hypothetical protein
MKVGISALILLTAFIFLGGCGKSDKNSIPVIPPKKPTIYAVSPLDTDPAIDDWLDDHYACINH